jgi:UDP-GlcNAc:undecaprenyl-phosphate GlcNAc-1-phosphate transferase
MFYVLIFILTFALTAIFTGLIRKIALYFKIVDSPDLPASGAKPGTVVSRKIHTRPIPLLGGLAIFLGYFSVILIFHDHFLSGDLSWTHLLGFTAGALILMIGGCLDDKYNLPPYQQIIFPLLAIGAVILGGVEITKITNPFGGIINLQTWFFLSPLLIALWLLGLMYTTKLLDGVDGLVSGVSAIGGLIIFLFTLTSRYYQPDIAFAALLLSAACLGFLVFNFNPAKIFLGEGGSLLLGYILGVLSIISGGKIAIALLIMGIPVLDVAWTIVRRLYQGHNPFRFADKDHLHHRLLALGLSQKKTVLVFYLLSLVFGLSGLFLQSRGKLLALIALAGLMLLFIIIFWLLDKKDIKSGGRISNLPRLSTKPRLLLHICCAPCGTYASLNQLAPNYDLTWYFYNPNLVSQEEYDRRLAAVKIVTEKYGWPLIVEPYEPAAWQKLVNGRENDPERGLRCQICYRDRLARTARLARQKKFDFFSTSLLVSPYKDTAAIRSISQELAKTYAVKFLDHDFQADDGYFKSQALAKELGLYRQRFCGCKYSKF